MTKEKAENIILAFQSLSKDDKEKVLHEYFNILLQNIPYDNEKFATPSAYAVNTLSSAMRLNQKESP